MRGVKYYIMPFDACIVIWHSVDWIARSRPSQYWHIRPDVLPQDFLDEYKHSFLCFDMDKLLIYLDRFITSKEDNAEVLQTR